MCLSGCSCCCAPPYSPNPGTEDAGTSGSDAAVNGSADGNGIAAAPAVAARPGAGEAAAGGGGAARSGLCT